MKKEYSVAAFASVVLAILAFFSDRDHHLLWAIIGFLSYGIVSYALSRSCVKGRASGWKVLSILLCGLLVAFLISWAMSPGFDRYVLVNTLFLAVGAVTGVVLSAGKMPLKIIMLLLAAVCSYYYFDLTKVYREFPAVKVLEVDDSISHVSEHRMRVYNAIGNPVELSSLTGKNELVLFFWDSSEYSKKKLPLFRFLHDKHKDDTGFSFYAVHCFASDVEEGEESEQSGMRYLEENGFELPSLSVDLDAESVRQWGLSSLPLVVLVDAQGNILERESVDRFSLNR